MRLLPHGWADGWQGQAIRFIFVGLGAAAIDYGVLAGLVSVGVSPYAARVVSLAIALVVAWQLNRRLTFRTRVPASWAEFRSYAVTALLGTLISFALYSVSLMLGAPLWAGFAIGTGVAAVFNFLRYRVLLSPGA